MSSSHNNSVRSSSPTARGAAAGAQAADAQYMNRSQVPALVERLLGSVVPSRHPRPFEAATQFAAPNPPPKASKKASVAAADPPSPTTTTASAQRRSIDDAMLDSLHFDVFTVDSTGPEGVELVVTIFERYQASLDALGILPATVRTWAAAVQRNYRPPMPFNEAPPPADMSDAVGQRQVFDGADAVPFHNFRHALNVLHTLHVYLTGFGAKAHFGDAELVAMLVAALSHDLQHPGRDNKFLAATAHPLAVRYNDMAVLEQHHCAMAFAILSEPGCDLCSGFRFAPPAAEGAPSGVVTSDAYRTFRECVVKCILGTEVAAHRSHTDALSSVIGEDGSTFNPKAIADHRARLMVSLVEAADISNEVRAFPFSRQWAPLVEEEFCRQGDAERALGLPVPTMRDREAVSRGKEQAGFITFLCLPLYETLAKVVAPMEECVRNLKANRDTWNALPS